MAGFRYPHMCIPGVRGDNYLIIGGRGTGVSTLARKIVTRHAETETKIVFFSEIDDPDITPEKYPLSALGDLLAQPVLAHHSIIIIDSSVINSSRIFESKDFGQLIQYGRRMNFTVILCLQYVMDLTPTIRSNFNHAMLLASKYIKQYDVKRFFEYYCDPSLCGYKLFANIAITLPQFAALHVSDGNLSILPKDIEEDR